jgi:hypothetical protein
MACIRSGDTGITEAVMEKARQSAKAGYRVLLLLEYGQAEKASTMSMGANSIPTEMRDSVRVQHVIHYPSQQLLWAGSSGWKGEWRQDSTGAFQSGEVEGQASKQRSVDGKPVGFNENRVDAWLFSPTTTPLTTFSNSGFRELVKIVSNTTALLPVSGQRPICTLNREFLSKSKPTITSGTNREMNEDHLVQAEPPSKKPIWVELRHEALKPDITFDTMFPATNLGWQPFAWCNRKEIIYDQTRPGRRIIRCSPTGDKVQIRREGRR